ncbi:sugar phosphate isomerase/epimerase [Clostridium sp. CF011]|uniref:sugar phosphate isomerase/epimerase family protein n=1 Tax=unclassified Clostridium TaxID=2614128 RepID=UPI001C0B2F75|nr:MULTISPECIES: sugar phosphate isomerase/epimerase [unclassified Clostridium]MBU3090845.1 sugar phosphate isomerase/epimerase [Clostridium sp. CF011]MBW9144588.1 sugar phosphate isomerase/epimerase [Clostridium sp. CM027]UVE40652.1 sugar phosphate isomerase/epimerase [Clostridium sp. CM027]WAG69618.1 sugar phosphate isomerase/epimerase [Clostridium sp. CF011]
MDIGLSSACFYPNLSTENSIKKMKELGFNHGEIFFNTPGEYEEDFLKRLLEKKETYEFNVNSVHAFSSSFEPYLFDKYDRRRLDMLKHFKKVCRAAKILGASCYTFHGMRSADFNELDTKFVIDTYNELSYIAMEMGIKLAQENVSWCMSANLKFLTFLAAKCKYPIYFTLDFKQAYKANVSIEKYIEVMGENIVNLHINDRDENSPCLLPGKGNLDYEYIYNKLKSVKYSGKGTIEVYSSNYLSCEELTQAKEFVVEKFNNSSEGKPRTSISDSSIL